MKILQVVPFFSPKFGGSVTVLYELSRKLAKRNHEVTILSTDFNFDDQYADQIRAEGVTVISFPCIVRFGLFLYSPSIKEWAENNLKEFDIIHLHNYRAYQNAVIHIFAKKYGIPYIMQAHGSVLPFFNKEFLKKCFDKVYGNKILQDATICIASTAIESDQYEKMGVSKNRIIIVPNGIDLSQFGDLPVRGQFRSKHNIPENVRLILTLGRIHKIKGIDLLVTSFSQICRKTGNVRLVIAGPDGGSLSQIREQVHELQIEDRVLFTGPLYDKEKLEAYIDSDIFVFPSRYDSFGNTLLEAWMCGLPVIVSTNCCVSSVIKNSNTGIVVGLDPSQITEQIINLLNDDENRRKLGISGKIFVQNNYDIDKIVQRIEEIYGPV